jgi:hypothetical protein
MKKSFSFLFAILFSFSMFAQTQWISKTSGTTGAIWGIDWVSATVVWISADNGDVKRSTDGGNTWTAAGNAGNGAYGIAAISDQIAVVATGPSSGDGKIMRTTNGGTTWTQVYTATGAWFNFIDNISSTVLWALSDPIGGNFHIVKSTDGGVTWVLAPNLPPQPATNVFGANNSFYRIGNTCWFGTGGNTGATAGNRVYKSVNGADGPWTFGTTTVQFPGSIAFSSTSGTGFAGFWSNATTYNKTTDGGATWTAQTSTYQTNGLDYVPGTSWCWAATSAGIYMTTNNGTTWTANTGATGTIYSVKFYNNSDVGLAGGTSGALYKSNLPPVPVEFTSFTAAQIGNVVNLNWATATEINNYGFEIQRSLDKGDFITVGFKNGNGTTTQPQQYQFSDNINDINATSISYRLKQIDFGGRFEYSKVVNIDNIAPTSLSLSQNFPNPFNPSTAITFSVPSDQFVSLKVYNSLGQEVSTLVNNVVKAGTHTVNFNGADLMSGIYYYTFKAGSFVQTNKMSLLK